MAGGPGLPRRRLDAGGGALLTLWSGLEYLRVARGRRKTAVDTIPRPVKCRLPRGNSSVGEHNPGWGREFESALSRSRSEAPPVRRGFASSGWPSWADMGNCRRSHPAGWQSGYAADCKLGARRFTDSASKTAVALPRGAVFADGFPVSARVAKPADASDSKTSPVRSVGSSPTPTSNDDEPPCRAISSCNRAAG